MINKNPSTDYFSHLTRSVAQMLQSILCDQGSIFRRGPQVVVGNALTPSGLDFYLGMNQRRIHEQDKGTFSCPVASEKFLVFRNPVKVCVGFSLRANNFHAEHRMRAYDKLVSFFFDQKSIEPFLPLAYQEYPGLYGRLASAKAELRINDAPITDGSGLDSFQFNFDYLALYHSGNPLREEQKTKQRVIEYFNGSTERSLQ